MGLIAVARGVGAAAVGDEHKVILNEVYGLLPAVLDINYFLCNLFVALIFDDNVLDVHAVLNAHAVSLEIFYKRQNHALILIVFCKAEGAEIGESVDMMHIAADITLHFKCA